MVWRLPGRPWRASWRAPAAPPSTRPVSHWAWLARVVVWAYGRATVGTLSVKVCRGQEGVSQKKAPHLEREADRARRPGQIGQRPAVIAMNAGSRLRTGRTGGGGGGHLHVQGQALILEREGLHLERRRQEASSKAVQRQHRVLLSWVRDNAGRQISLAIIPDCCVSRTLGKNQ